MGIKSAYSPSQISTFTFLIALLIGITVLIICIIAWCKIFRKAGIHPGKLFIPFFGAYLKYSIADSGSLFVASIIFSVSASLISSCNTRSYMDSETSKILLVISGISIVAYLIIRIIFLLRLARKFNKSLGFAIGLVFLYPIFICILGFEQNKKTGFYA